VLSSYEFFSYDVVYLLLVSVSANVFSLPKDMRILNDVAYAEHKNQMVDVYLPAVEEGAPVIFMVHGGMWRIGDKSSRSVIQNKMKHWVNKGFIFISVNYRLLPDARPVEQMKDVEKALLFSQNQAHLCGRSSSKFILMGRSAGAHLVSLLSSSYARSVFSGLGSKVENKVENVAKSWLGTIAIDSAAYDIVKIMNSAKPPRFYKKVFGSSLDYWKAASPLHMLTSKIPPFLAICSTQRDDGSCTQASSFVDKATMLGTMDEVLAVNLSHRQASASLGKRNDYTRSVDAFIKGLHPSFCLML
jgi:arylformamidase